MNEKESKLKLVHLVYLIAVASVAVGIAWGTMNNQQDINKAEIEKKLDSEIFIRHEDHQRRQFESLEKNLDKSFKRIDISLEKIEKKL